MFTKYHVHSNSFPFESHPNSIRIQQDLCKIKTWESTLTSTSDSIIIDISFLEDLYVSLEDLLGMSSTQKVISHQGEKFVQELLDGSVKILYICGITRDTILQIKENVEALHSSLRKRKGNSTIETSVYGYKFFTHTKKNVTKLITSLKQMESKFGASGVLNEDQELVDVIRVIREVIVMNMSIFHSLLSFLYASKSKLTKWLRVTKLMNKRVTSCEDKLGSFNELKCVETTLSPILGEGSNVFKMQAAHERLKTSENVIEMMENGLENVFRRLVKTKVYLLNIVTIP